ncbi:protein spire [Tribolium castaneum]|uniref:Spire n=1 Tax=Tribolium castaneum TaxID=7070 RepID=D6WL34_TRICA|nr:PREDICTED: protein spire [Tribolium castaneum]EFA04670.1 spire [Tribolium castaneum]|eukprot:XP_972170.1 PREDICTED: protein spire [Tribolium castaneum]
MSAKAKCKVNSDGSVCLEDILNSFNSSIREEHAWALCYQCAKYYSECVSSRKQNVHIVTEVRHVYLQTDGNVHENTIKARDTPRKLLRCEKDVIAGLGVVIYIALDQGSQNDEERVISQDLEQLISDMISDELNSSEQTHHETDDEGIERDSEEGEEEPGTSRTQPHMTLQEVIRRCESHLGTLTKTQTEAHYKAVVRALVAEALELATFLEKVAQGSLNLPTDSSKQADLDQLKFSDWAKFWVQVMGELRMGVKLRKVHYSRAPIEYELTPYEILMKDIRSCRYKLRRIMVNGDVPSRVTKDAHAIILEFIRSRPPLKKVSDRKLPPQSRTLTPREQLLNSIKKGRKLRPTPRSPYMLSEPKQQTKEDSSKPNRRLIKVDFSQFEDEDDDEPIDSPDSTGLWSASEYLQMCDTTLEAYDLATQDLNRRSTLRRHTLEVCDPNLGCYSVPQSRPCSRQSCNSSEAESVQLEPEVAKAMQDELTNARSWQDTISLDDRLSLTLSEIVHIRAVLTKAELEALPVEGRVRHDVESRKVCFLCLKTRFGIFGPWGQRCTLCKRTVCAKCCAKMNIPMEHFSSVPVVLLSPSIMSSPETEAKEAFPKSLVNKMMEGPPSADHSPETSRPSSSMESSTISDPGSLGRFRAKAAAAGRAARVVDKFKASQMVVCHDCRMMVLQIIKSARANRSAIRNKTLQSLTLNLSPVF